jgi:carboxyvinyl-carboxyphosphonate phosphorylmutase
MTATERRQSVRAILAGGACIHPGSVFDPISARIASDLGFPLGMFAGSIAALTVLGAPDIVLLTLTEFADQARRITRAAPDLPLLVDADHGYGNALNAMRTVEELEAAGVAALTIEDTRLPAAYGETAPALVSREEGLGKLRAALAARTDPATVIVARTSAADIAGTEEAIARATLYAAERPDALFLAGLRSAAQLAAIAAAVPGLPLILGGAEVGLDAAGLAAHGVRIALQGHQPFMAAIEAVRATLAALRDGADAGGLPGLPSAETRRRASREGEWRARAAAYLGV